MVFKIEKAAAAVLFLTVAFGNAQAATIFSSAKAYDSVGAWQVYYSGSQNACIAEHAQGQGEKPFTDGLTVFMGYLLGDSRVLVGFHNPALPALDKGQSEDVKFISESGAVATKSVGFIFAEKSFRLTITENVEDITDVFQHEGRILIDKQPSGGGDPQSLAVVDTRAMKAVLAALDACKSEAH